MPIQYLSTIEAPSININSYKVLDNTYNSSSLLGATLFSFNALQDGKCLHTNYEFALANTNNIGVYNNAANGVVTATRITTGNADYPTTAPPNSTGAVVCLKYTGVGSPGLGGFVQSFNTKANAKYIQVFRALIPVGYTLSYHNNPIGTNGSQHWLTNNVGTGRWEEYIRVVHAGNTGTFSSAGHIALNISTGATPTSAAPLLAYISFATVYEITDYSTKDTISGLRDTLISSPTTGQVLSLNASNIWVNTTLSASGIGAEPSITAGTTTQYWRGDKSWQTLDKTAVGLNNVDNTTDSSKAVASAGLLRTIGTITDLNTLTGYLAGSSIHSQGSTNTNGPLGTSSTTGIVFNLQRLNSNTDVTVSQQIAQIFPEYNTENWYLRNSRGTGSTIDWKSWRKIWHDGNSNLITIDWNTQNLTAVGRVWAAIQPTASMPTTGNLLTNNSFNLLAGDPNNANKGAYGLHMGILGNGSSWIQVGRTDGTATNYELSLQPNGGNVTINTNTVWHAGNSNLNSIDWTTKDLTVNGRTLSPRIDLRRETNTTASICFFNGSTNTTNNAWQLFASNAVSNVGINGNITVPTGNLVTNWSLRSIVTNTAGNGWTFESMSPAGTSTTIVAELSNTGKLRVSDIDIYSGTGKISVDFWKHSRGTEDSFLWSLDEDLENDLGLLSGFASVTRVLDPDAPFVGKAIEAGTSYLSYYSDFIPVEAGATIYTELFYKKVSGTDDTKITYFGIERYDADKRTIATNNGTVYTIANSASNSTTWTKLSGYHTLPLTHTPFGTPASNGLAVKYIKVRLLLNFSGSGTASRRFGGFSMRRVINLDQSNLNTLDGTIILEVTKNTAFKGIFTNTNMSANRTYIMPNVDGTLYNSGNSNSNTIDWTAKNLTLNGSITGATTISASTSVTAPSFLGNATSATTSTNIAGGALGSIPYQSSANTTALLTGNITSTKLFLTQTGTGSVSAAPVWSSISSSDIPSLDVSKLTSGTLSINRGGTGMTTVTQWGVIYASTTSALASTSAGTAGQVLTSNATSAPTWTSTATAATANTLVLRDSNGGITCAGLTATSITETSDARKKTIIETKKSNLLETLDIIDFQTKDTGKIRTGVIAQELKELCPELVYEDSEGYLSVDYTSLILKLIRELKNK